MLFKKYVIQVLLFIFFVSISQIWADTSDIRLIYTRGVQDLAANRLTSAESNFNKVISNSDSLEDAGKYKAGSYYYLGDVYFIRQDFEKAIGNYKIVVQKFYNQDVYTRTLYKLGRTLVLAGYCPEGIAMLNDYVIRYDNTDSLADNALYWIARGYFAQGDIQQALSTYQLVLDKYPATTLSYEIRKSIDQINQVIAVQNKTLMSSTNTNVLLTIRQKNEKLANEKILLEKMSRLLEIKQRLLEIKAEKVELLGRLREMSSQFN